MQTNKQTKKLKSAPKNIKRLSNWFTAFVIGCGVGFSCHFISGINDSLKKEAIVRSIQHVTLEKNEHLPQAIPVLARQGYTLAYDGRAKTALWVYEELTKESCNGNNSRSECQFVPDPDVPTIIQADLLDYRGSGFDRGHLAPAADHKASALGLEQTFYLSNISPQMPQFNRGYWNKLEKHVRDLTKDYSVVRVVTGPLYLPHQDQSGKKYVTYEVIGKNDVAVPTHFFKLITAEEGRLSRQWAYIMPNEPIDHQTSFDSFLTTIENLEKVSGIVFN